MLLLKHLMRFYLKIKSEKSEFYKINDKAEFYARYCRETDCTITIAR